MAKMPTTKAKGFAMRAWLQQGRQEANVVMKVLVTGGAGFIGSALVRRLLASEAFQVVNVDVLTYAACPAALDSLSGLGYAFEKVDVCDRLALEAVFEQYRPDAVIHAAAESHVDRSIGGPAGFVQTNVVGTFTLLEVARAYWAGLGQEARSRFRFLQVSTDEVFGELSEGQAETVEGAGYSPNSPYAATKAGADHLVRAWFRTYGFPILISHSANNYGPFQFPEKLIPLMTLNALHGQPLPVYGDGRQMRDWLYVDDHAEGLVRILEHGEPGQSYNLAGGDERRNLDVVEALCEQLEVLAPQRYVARKAGGPGYRSLVKSVADRPGHDFRYAMKANRARDELGWRPVESFQDGLKKTLAWYVANVDCWEKDGRGGWRYRSDIRLSSAGE